MAILVLVASFQLQPCSGAETAEDETRPLPTRFFRKLQGGGDQTVVVYGTSLSHTAEWPKAFEAWLGKEFSDRVTFVNAASSGKQSDWGLGNLSKRVLSHDPDLVILEFSMNDSATKHGISRERAIANLDSMVKRLTERNPEVEVVLQVMNPVFNGNDGKAAADARPELEGYYDDYHRYARTHGLPMVDHYPSWDELRRNDEEKYRRWMPDGTHPVPDASLAVTWENLRTFMEAAVAEARRVPPTMSEVPYGEHERQVLDFWRAPSDEPTPVVFYMHGGAWMNGDKASFAKNHMLPRYLAAGVSVVSINYRFVWQAREAHVKPPVEWPMRDAKRALQFVRSKAGDWNLDRERVALAGSSAGACTSLWLTFHDDMAEPDSADPVARESTRPYCVAVEGAQTSLDPLEMTEWTPNSRYGHHAFGFSSPKDFEKNVEKYREFLEGRDGFSDWIRQYSPYGHADAGDPPVYLFYKVPPAPGKEQKDPTHSANFGVKLKEKLDRMAVPCELVYPGAPDVRHRTIDDYLIGTLKL